MSVNYLAKNDIKVAWIKSLLNGYIILLISCFILTWKLKYFRQ